MSTAHNSQFPAPLNWNERLAPLGSLAGLLTRDLSPSAAKQLSHPKYRPDIDGLRAIAVLSVVGFHAFPGFVRGGFIGVDIFFVISGFLISTIIFENSARGTFSFAEFYIRRIRRIFPALMTVLAACLIAGWLVLFPNEYRMLGAHTAGGAGFISNLLLWSESGYFDISSYEKPLVHLWSLGIEEQFYILWPPLVYAAWTRRYGVAAVIVAGLAASFAANVSSVRGDSVAAFYSPASRFWELLIGSGLAYVMSRPGFVHPTGRAAEYLSVAGLLTLLLGFLFIHASSHFPGYWALLPTLGAALIIAAGPAAFANRALLGTRLLVWMGLISFPLYLWHWPLLSFLRIVHGMAASDASVLSRLLFVALAIALASLTYLYIERPLRFGPHGVRKAGLLMTLAITVGLSGLMVWQKSGFAERLAVVPASAKGLFEPYPHAQRNSDCAKVYPSLSSLWACMLSKPQEADIAIIGDSHANQYYISLARALPDHSVLNLGSPSCFPFSAADLSQAKMCRNDTAAFMRLLSDHPSIKTYYVTGYFSYLMAGGFPEGNVEGRRRARPLTEDQRQSFEAAAMEWLSALVAAKKDVVLILDIPDLIVKPMQCVELPSAPIIHALRAPAWSAGAPKRDESGCFIERAEYEKRIEPYDRVLKALTAKFPGVRVFDPRPFLCEEERCWIIRGDRVLYWNSDHLTVEGADMIVDQLLRAMPQPLRARVAQHAD